MQLPDPSIDIGKLSRGARKVTETYVLVHGSWHGSWAWDPVAWMLRELGHRVVTPALPGEEPTANRAGIRHDDYVAAVVTQIERLDLRNVVLVGHSFAGSVIAPVWQKLPSRVKRLIFETAFVIGDGESVSDNVPAEQKANAIAAAAESPDGTTQLSWEVFRDKFIQDASPEAARVVYDRLVPQPYQPSLDLLDLHAFYSSDIPRSYITATDDMSLPEGYWAKMAARLGPNCKQVSISGSHEVMFTRPHELAERIIEASRD